MCMDWQLRVHHIGCALLLSLLQGVGHPFLGLMPLSDLAFPRFALPRRRAGLLRRVLECSPLAPPEPILRRATEYIMLGLLPPHRQFQRRPAPKARREEPAAAILVRQSHSNADRSW